MKTRSATGKSDRSCMYIHTSEVMDRHSKWLIVEEGSTQVSTERRGTVMHKAFKVSSSFSVAPNAVFATKTNYGGLQVFTWKWTCYGCYGVVHTHVRDAG